MKYSIILFLLCLSINNYAQRSLITVPDAPIVAILDSAYNCNNIKKETNCELIYEHAIKTGKKMDIKYMDYLYYTYSFYLESKGLSDAALQIIDSILPIATNDTVIDAMMNTKATILYNQGNTEGAIKLFVRMAERCEKRGDFKILAYTYLNISGLLASQNNYTSSLDYLLKSHEVMESSKDSSLLINVRANIAAAYYDLTEYTNAVTWAELSINTPVINEKDESGKIMAYMILAQVFMHTDLDAAVIYIKKSIALGKKLNNDSKLSNSYLIYAEILEKMGKYKEAAFYIEKNIDMYRSNIFLPGLANSLLLAGKISIKNGDYKKASDYLLEANILNDSLKSEKNFRTINELNTKYETEVKERKIAESQLQIAEKNKQIRTWTIVASIIIISAFIFIFQLRRNQKNKLKIMQQENENELLKAKVKGEEIERGRVSRELHDGVASSLLVTRLQLEKNTEGSNIQAAIMLQSIHKEIRNIAHKLNPIDFTQKNWVQEVENYCANVAHENTQVHFFSNIDTLTLDPTKSLVLFRGIQELLQNAIKHAAATNISLQIVSDEASLHISIEDDGNGAQQSLLDNAESLQNLKIRMKDIGATLNVESSLNEGLMAIIDYKYG